MEKQDFYNHKKPRQLMDQLCDVMRLKHYAFRTEQIYVNCVSFPIKWTIVPSYLIITDYRKE